MSQNKSPEGSISYGWVESAGPGKVVVDEVTEVDGECVGMKRYVGNNSFSLEKGESLDITHNRDETGHEFVELVLKQTISGPQEMLPLAVPLNLIVEAA